MSDVIDPLSDTPPAPASTQTPEEWTGEGKMVVRSMPITEVRADRVICQWHVHYEDFPMEAIDIGDMTPKPGDRVVEYADGRKVLMPAQGRPPAPAGGMSATTEVTKDLPSEPVEQT